MIPSLILYLLVVGGLVAVSAAAVDGAFRRSAIPTRWVWVAALGAMVVFAIAAPRRAPVEATLSLTAQVAYVTADSPLSPTTSIAAKFLRGQQWADAMLSSAFVALDAGVPARVASAAAIAWAAMSALVLMLLGVVHRRMHRARQQWPTAELHGTRVRLAPLAGPAVIGLTRPEIVLPRWLLERDVEDQRLVLAHENEHVSARDHLLPIGAWLVAAALPWHPAVWWMLSRLRLAMELDCDARVLKRGVPVREYGRLLIDIAGRYGASRAGALALADRSSHLERRLHAMKQNRTRFNVVRSVALGAVACLALVAACEARLPTASEITTMDVTAAERAATALLLPAAGGTLRYGYIVDGQPATEAEARALPGSRIASVSMMKPRGDVPDAVGLVTITTVEYEAANPAARGRARATVADGNAKRATDIHLPYGKGAPLVVVDGVVVTEQRLLAKIRSANVESVEVLKGSAATSAYSHPAAFNGVIMIATKGGTKGSEAMRLEEPQPNQGILVPERRPDALHMSASLPTPSTSKQRTGFTGLVYVNGVLSSNAAFEAMKPETISSVEVIKGAAAAALSSDPAAANGIIKITTKSSGTR